MEEGAWQTKYMSGLERLAVADGDGAVNNRLPLVRPKRGEAPHGFKPIIAGVAAGLGAHLGISPWLLRFLFLLGTPIGMGVLLYLWFWTFVPRGNPWENTPADVASSRLSTPNASAVPATDAKTKRRSHTLALTPAILLALFLLAAAIFLGVEGPRALAVARPAVIGGIILGGFGMIWAGATRQTVAQLDTRRFLLLGIPGALVVIFGVVLAFSGTISWRDAAQGGVIALLVLALLSLAALPLWVRFWNDFKASLSEQTRQTVRADMAAHLHDSVLQTLALIRARAENPTEVAKLARAEERQLRAWLYEDRASANQSLVQVLKDVVGEVEDRYGVVFETVSVGDAPPGPWSEPLVNATREALTNAVKHGAPAYSVYLEITADSAQCFVRDHGKGFDLDSIPQGHHGVKGSIVERLERHGGNVKIKTGETGTEVQMEVKRQ